MNLGLNTEMVEFIEYYLKRLGITKLTIMLNVSANRDTQMFPQNVKYCLLHLCWM